MATSRAISNQGDRRSLWGLGEECGRFILPFVGQPPLVPGGQPTFGISDIVLSAFLSPAHSRRAIWGVGPVLTLPTTTDPLLGSGKWAVGPTAVVLRQSGPWTYGALVNHLWSYASVSLSARERPEVNQTLIQPFLSFTTPTGVTLAVNTESTGNWEVDEEQWTVPINVVVSKVLRLGPFPFQIGAGAGSLPPRPKAGPRGSFGPSSSSCFLGAADDLHHGLRPVPRTDGSPGGSGELVASMQRSSASAQRVLLPDDDNRRFEHVAAH